MEVWGKIRWTTKLLIIVMAGMVMVLIILAISRIEAPSNLFKLPFWKAQVSVIPASQESAAVIAGLSTISPGSPSLYASTSSPIYSGPGVNYSLVALLEGGQRAQVTGVSQDRGWWQITVPYLASGSGWVSAENVVVENADGVPVVVDPGVLPLTPTAREFIPMVTAVINVNVRTGPSLTNEKVGVLKKGESAEVLGIDPERFWWLIVFNEAPDGKGWVSVDYVGGQNTAGVPVIDLGAIEGSLSVPTPISGGPSLTATTMINVRSGPGAQHSVLGKLEAGQKAQVLGFSVDRQWVAILIDNLQDASQGWVSVAYVTLENAGSLPVIQIP